PRNLGGPPPRPHLGRGIDIDLHLSIRKYHRADVTAVEDGPRRYPPEIALESEERGPDLRESGNDRGGLADRVALEDFFVKTIGVKPPRDRDRALDIIQSMPGIDQPLSHCAVDQPSVEVAKPVVGGEPLAERSLAGSRRPVDGDDHGCLRPLRARRSGRSSVKILREANSAGLAKVRYSRIPGLSMEHVCHECSR